jgi:hypothetical protein
MFDIFGVSYFQIIFWVTIKNGWYWCLNIGYPNLKSTFFRFYPFFRHTQVWEDALGYLTDNLTHQLYKRSLWPFSQPKETVLNYQFLEFHFEFSRGVLFDPRWSPFCGLLVLKRKTTTYFHHAWLDGYKQNTGCYVFSINPSIQLWMVT